MTTFEHAMLGLTMALAAGAHRRHGWALPATAAVAAALPDWDAVALVFGAEAFSKVHRVWGHNVLCAGLLGALTGGVGYLCYLSVRVRKRVRTFLQRSDVHLGPSLSFQGTDLAVWLSVGVFAGVSHLPADLIYPWPIALLWPFTDRGWAFPILDWSEMGTIVLLLAEMFALYYLPRFAQLIAWVTLAALGVYVSARWLLTDIPIGA
jgi:membrane-bound metal-dependent hydrolase YbcI (DUF457 family)